MTTQVMSKFEEIYKKIAQKKYYIEPKCPRMDNWSVDIYETPTGFFARMSDSGYSREIGWKNHKGEVTWKVCDYYPAPLKFSGCMTEVEFRNLRFE